MQKKRILLALFLSFLLSVAVSLPVFGQVPAKLAAGYWHSFSVEDDGTVWAWGFNYWGQLGDGTRRNDRLTPVQVSGLADVVAVDGAWSHSLAVKSDGTVWAWGGNGSGKLGDGTYSSGMLNNDRLTPVQVKGPGGTGYLTGAVMVGAGKGHSLALKSDGTVWAWGWNGYGQLGDGGPALQQRLTPVQVSSLTDVVAVSTFYDHSLALKSDGTVWAWGDNYNGQLGIGTTTGVRRTPVQVPGITDVVAVSTGVMHSLALKSDGTVWAWGNNWYGQLGDGTTGDWESEPGRGTPVQVSGLTAVVAIASGGYHSLAVKSDGTVWAWGANYYGQLGDGTMADRPIPVQTAAPVSVRGVAAGMDHSLGLGSVWAWGGNGSGQVGDGTKTNRSTPVQVPGIRGWSGPPAAPADSVPPVTTATLTGAAGNDGWHVSPVTVTLSCSDDASGCAGTRFSLDGGAAWQEYMAPLELAAEGITSVLYRSVDRAGNEEPIKSQDVKLDWTPPATSAAVSPAPAADGWHYQLPVVVSLAAADSLSGVAGIVYHVQSDPHPGGEGWRGHCAAASCAIPLAQPGVYKLSYRAADAAGNEEEAQMLDVRVGIEVAVDIKPGSDLNSINPRSRGVVPVAVLTTETFDASAIATDQVRFGKEGIEALPERSSLEDVDGDGDNDLLLHFDTQDAGIEPGDAAAWLTGSTRDGLRIRGRDSIRTVPR